ncbi:unnamed protein product [Oikopleura dioica]|uniref:Uncharacterized protein n=1 Tax=Oikopleura dioica TaxID=34765 RepID=E4XNQ6_OIKDI|nr:unnamed protein product [Oikopleura dioica]CBY36392.1 unnamed protein product [Oikopleura dioica]
MHVQTQEQLQNRITFFNQIKRRKTDNMGCHYKASRIAGLSGFGLLLGLGSMATAFGNIAKISLHTEENYKDWIPLDNMPGYISGFFTILSGSFGLSLLCMSTAASSASCAVACALAFSITAMLSSTAALIVNINSVLAIEQSVEPLWRINAAQEIIDYFRRDNNEILIIMLEVSAGLNFANLIIQLSIAFVICCSVPGFCCAPASIDARMEKGNKNYAMENGSVGNVDDLAQG